MERSGTLFLNHPEIWLPLRVVRARRGVGSFITIDLLDDATACEPTNWRIWVYLSDWVLTDGQTDVLDSECTDNALYEQHLSKLENTKLQHAIAIDSNETCEFLFSTGFKLFVDDASDIYGEDSEMLMIFRDDRCLGYFKPGKGFEPQ